MGIRKELLELCTETAQKFLVPRAEKPGQNGPVPKRMPVHEVIDVGSRGGSVSLFSGCTLRFGVPCHSHCCNWMSQGSMSGPFE